MKALGGKEVATLRSGEVLGELSFLDSRPPSASVIATTEVTVLALSRQKLNAKLAADAPFAARFYRALFAGKLLPRQTLDDLMLPEQMGIGYNPTGCGAAYGHGGALFNYTAAARVSADGKTAAVLLLNARGPDADARIDEAVRELFCSG